MAASRGDLATLRLMHSVGANLVAADNAGRTPLHNAAVKDCTSAITYLVHKGAYVDVCDASGCSPLHVAARSGAAGACSRLLDLGAAAQLCSNRELTALGTLPYHSKALSTSVPAFVFEFALCSSFLLLVCGAFQLLWSLQARVPRNTLCSCNSRPYVFSGSS